MTSHRRDFLKQVLAVTVTTVACPHISLGRVIPEISVNDTKITGIYKVKVTDYPVLKDLWGSVRLNVDAMPPKFSFPKIIVSKVDPLEFNAEYTVVTESCPHEAFPVELLSPDFIVPLFECKRGHGSRYTADGNYFWGVSMKNLERYITTFDGVDTLSIEIPAIVGVNSLNEIPELSYLSQNFPNPCANYTEFKYGIEKPSYVKLSVHDIKGYELEIMTDSFISEGNYSCRLALNNYQSGNYFFRMVINHTLNLTKTFTVTK